MRIISGKYKSRRIQVPPNLKARPTTDFAKEGLFNILNNRIEWKKTTALDLFSGTGSIAFELVSRGCPHVTSVEINPIHYQFICKTKDLLKAEELYPVKSDVFKYIQLTNEKFDFIFADPPYDLPQGKTIPLIILKKQMLQPEGIFIMEHSKSVDFSDLPLFVEERNYGNVHFSIFENRQ